jgi:hypothetical protein
MSVQTFYPKVESSIEPNVQRHLQMIYKALNNHAQAFEYIKSTYSTSSSSSSSTTSSTTSTTSSGTSSTIVESYFTGFGTVNDQTGNTSYTVQASDSGALVVFDDASAVAVTLNSLISPPWMSFITNFGAGVVTLTPSSGTINGDTSLALSQHESVLAVFDGTNWETTDLMVLAQTIAAVSHEWLNSYDAMTGSFTQSQPAFTDISGTVAASQLPTPTTSTLGGVEAIVQVASEWINSISTSGVPQLSQPAIADISGLVAALALLAPLASPALTGTPTAPTATSGTDTTQVATTAFVETAVSTVSGDVSTETARAEAAEALLAPKASPTFTGTISGVQESLSSSSSPVLAVSGTSAGPQTLVSISNSTLAQSLTINVPGTAGNYSEGSVLGDTVIRTETGNLCIGTFSNSSHILMGSSTAKWLEVSSAGVTYPDGSVQTSGYAGEGILLDVSDTGQTLSTAAFSIYILPTVNTDTASGYNTSTGYYTIPVTGIYLITTKMRITDSSPEFIGYGQGAGTTIADPANFQWFMTFSTSVGSARNGSLNTRIVQLTKGQTVCMSYYYDSSIATTTLSASMNIALLGTA